MLTIYKASAGSGKTYTLALQYIKLLLGAKRPDTGRYVLNKKGRNAHRHILAITFTNKATEEMKSRIVRQIDSLAHDFGNSDYGTKLVGEFGCTEEELSSAADRALRDLLHDYQNFHVSTIDSFFQSVLRTFAREVEHQGDYGVEIDDRLAVTSAVGMMLDDLNYGHPAIGPKMLRWLQNFAIERVENGRDFNLFNRRQGFFSEIVRFVENTGDEAFKRHEQALADYLAGPDLIGQFRRALRVLSEGHMEALRRSCDETIGAFAAAGFSRECIKTIGLFDKIAGGEMPTKAQLGLTDNPKDGVFFRRLVEGEAVYTKSKLPTGRTKKDIIYPGADLDERLIRWARQLQTAYALHCVTASLIDACPNLEALSFAHEYVRRFREDNNIILLSDTNDLLRRIINKSETPFIYERMGVTLEHFLIDEFQDTSHMQWENLRPLVATSLDQGHDNLIIGDEKQSIYRFRNSDSSLLGHTVAENDFPTQHLIRGNAHEENTNHRSAADLVRFNNTVFRRFAAAIAADGYGNITQGISERNVSLPAYVRLRNLADDPDIAAACEAAEAVGGRKSDVRVQAILSEMAGEIRRQKAAGYGFGDIAVLVRRRKEAAAVVEYLLENCPDIKVVSDEALYLRNSQAVRLIVGVLEMLDKTWASQGQNAGQDGTSQGKGTKYATLDDIMRMTSRFEYFVGGGVAPSEALRLAITDGDDIDSDVRAIRAKAPANLIALVEAVIERKVSVEMRRSELAYIAAFQDCVLDFSSRFNPSLHAFLRWWGTMKDRLSIPAGKRADGVSVMTVHKAKGLEWDCVHVPFASWEMVKTNEGMWLPLADGYPGVDSRVVPPVVYVNATSEFGLPGSPFADVYNESIFAQQIDNLNLAYVTFTRAVRELCVWVPERKGVAQFITEAIAMPSTPDEEHGLHIDTAARLDENGNLTIGRPTEPVGREDAGEAAFALDDYPVTFRDDTSRLTTLVDAPAAFFNADVSAEDGDTESEELPDGPLSLRNAMARRGTALHGILNKMRSPREFERVLASAAVGCGLDEATVEEYRELFRGAFTHAGPLIDRWFDPEARVLCEQSIYVAGRGDTYRPDRIVLAKDGSVDVVDYKFTSAPRSGHREQVEAYVGLLRDMGYDRVDGYLWYPELRQIIKIE